MSDFEGKVRISWFDRKENPSSKTILLAELCSIIASPTSAHAGTIKLARKALAVGNKSQYGKLKGRLPAVTISGVFQQRNKAELLEHTGLLLLDIDKLSESGHSVTEIKRQVCEIATTCVCFVSPSGDGLKVVVRTTCKASQHEETVQSLMEHYGSLLKIEIDGTGKDVSRLCFLSYDPDIYVKYDSSIFAPKMNGKKKIVGARKLLDKRLVYPDCGRNNYVFNLACITNKFGVPFEATTDYCVEKFKENDFDAGEISRAVSSGYRNAEEFGIWKSQKIRLDNDPAALSSDEYKSVRDKLGIADYVNNEDAIAQILIGKLVAGIPLTEDAENTYDLLREYRKHISPKSSAGLVIRTALERSATTIDDLLNDYSPRGRLCRKVANIIANPLPTTIKPTGVQILLKEYLLVLLKTAFETAFHASDIVPENAIESHAKFLSHIESQYQRMVNALSFCYELEFKSIATIIEPT